MSHTAPRPITPAFAKRLFRTWVTAAIAAVGGFLWLHYQSHGQLEKRATLTQAQLVAAAIVPGPNGDLFPSVSRLLSRCDTLVAVASLSPFGQVERVYPDRPAFREALDQAVAQLMPGGFGAGHTLGAYQTELESPEDGQQIRVNAAVIPVAPSESYLSGHVAVLVRSPTDGIHHVESATAFASVLALVGFCSFLSLRGWFDRRVADPLRSIVRTAVERSVKGDRYIYLKPGDLRETTELAQQLHELLRNLEETDAKSRRLEHDTEKKLRDKEEGFQRQLRRATDRALTDPLTRLRNRAFLEENLERVFEQQRGSGGDLAAVAIDLDNFKGHNDTHGHLAGDAILRFTGVLLRGATRPSDFAIRYGGDEFVLLLPGANQTQATTIATRILKLFNQHIRGRSPQPTVSMSAGVASLQMEQCTTGHELIARADAALYTVKRAGKNGVATLGSGDGRSRKEQITRPIELPSKELQPLPADAAA